MLTIHETSFFPNSALEITIGEATIPPPRHYTVQRWALAKWADGEWMC